MNVYIYVCTGTNRRYLELEQVPYHEQGNHTFYLERVVEKREAVARDPLVQRCIGRLWALIPKNGRDGRHILRKEFIDFHLCLQRVLFDPFNFSEAMRRAEVGSVQHVCTLA